MVDTPSIGAKVSVATPASLECATDVREFLQEGKLPSDSEEPRKVRNWVAQFTLLERVLYKRGFSEPFLRCLSSNEVQYVLVEIHERICRSHLR